MPIVRPLSALIALLLLAACGANDGAAGSDAAAARDPGAAPASSADARPAPAGATATDAPGTAAASMDPANFELDMARVDRWLDATRRLSALTKADPALEDVVAADASEPREAYVARLEGHPGVAAAIRDAGMSPTEYALTTETLLGALFAIGMLDAGAIPELPEAIRDTQPVAFVQANKAAITAKMEALKRGAE